MAAEQKQEEPTVSVTYWAGRGQAEPSRLLLAAAGVDFENKFLSKKEEFDALKESGYAQVSTFNIHPFHMIPVSIHSVLAYDQVPLVQMDGLDLVQTGAQFRYIADKYKLRGSTLKESYVVDVVYEGCKDARRCLMGFPFHGDRDQILEKELCLLKKRVFYIHSVRRRCGGV